MIQGEDNSTALYIEEMQMAKQTGSQMDVHNAYELTREFSRFDGYEEVELADHGANLSWSIA
jgi:hypothetical protein